MPIVTKPLSDGYGSRNQGTGIPSHALHPGIIQYHETVITSAQLLAGFATPILVLPAPGDGLVIEFISATCILDYGSATYANNGTCLFQFYDGGTVVSDTCGANALLHQANDCVEVIQALSAEVELSANTGIEFSCEAGEMITGDSDLRVKIAFRVHVTGL